MYTNYIDPTISAYKPNLYGTIGQTPWVGQNTLGFKPSWFGSVESLTTPYAQGLNTPYVPYQGFINHVNPFTAVHNPVIPGLGAYGLQGLNTFGPRLPFHPTLGGLGVAPIDPRVMAGIQQGFGFGDIQTLMLQQYLAQQEILRCQALGCVPGLNPFGLNLGPQAVRVI